MMRRGPFWIACWKDNHESVSLMIQDPWVDINLDNNFGWSPWMVACLNGHTQTNQLLLSFGRKIDVFKKSIKYDYSGIKSDSTALDVHLNKPPFKVTIQNYYPNWYPLVGLVSWEIHFHGYPSNKQPLSHHYSADLHRFCLFCNRISAIFVLQ